MVSFSLYAAYFRLAWLTCAYQESIVTSRNHNNYTLRSERRKKIVHETNVFRRGGERRPLIYSIPQNIFTDS